jgi:cyanophycinase
VSLDKYIDILTKSPVQVTLQSLEALSFQVCSTPIPRILILCLTFLSSCSDPSQEMGPRLKPITECPEPSTGIIIGSLYGNTQDAKTQTQRSLVLMGGGREHDEASNIFLESTNGGDIIILRASGSLTSYPNYFMSTLSSKISANSALTVLTSSPQKAMDSAITCRLKKAEGVWLAGGNQWDYLGGWPQSFQVLLGQLTTENISVGGTSAGAVSLGEAAFDAQHGTISSQQALADPLSEKVSVSYPIFFQPELKNTLIDSHFTERNREGRLLTFLARFKSEKDRPTVVGIGLDEGVALVIKQDHFEVFAPTGRYAWIYELSGPVSLTTDAKLNLTQVVRLKLTDTTKGSWPVQVQSQDPDELVVINGAIQKNPLKPPL